MRWPGLAFLMVVYLLAISSLPVHAAEPVELKAFLENPAKYDGKEILVSGFLSLEDYGKALFLTQEEFAEGRFENSVPVIMPYNILNMREAFQRTFVKIRAVYHHDCADPEMFCSAHPGQGFLGPVLELWGERLPRNERPVYRKPTIPMPWDEMTISEAEDPDHENIVQLAYNFAQAVKAGDRAALLGLFETESRQLMVADGKKSHSRSEWLLFSGQYNYRAAFLAAKSLTIIPLRMMSDTIQPQVAAACFCMTKDCNGALSNPMPSAAVTTGSFMDPYKCLPFYKSKSGWVVDAGFLLSDDEESPFGTDLGTMARMRIANTGAKPVSYMHSQPSWPSSPFLTRLRERPRPRSVNALQKGRVKLPIFYIAPSGALWTLELIDGRPRVREIATDGAHK